MSLLDLPVRRPVAVAMVFVGMVVLGLVGLQRIAVELFPAVQGDSLYVSFWRQGAEPEVVERDILMPLDARVAALPLVAESGGQVRGAGGNYWVRFEQGGDIKVRELELRRIAAAIERAQPRGTASVQVSSTESRTATIGSFVMMVHVLGAADQDTLFDFAEELLAPRFAAVAGVSEAVATGGARRQVTVRIDPARLAATGVGPQEVSWAVAGQVRQMRHVGSLESEGGRADVLVDGRPAGLDALREARIRTDSPVRIGHVADVQFGYAPKQTAFRVNGDPAVGVVIFQEQGANLIRLGRSLRARVDELREELAPLGLDLVIGDDAAEIVEEQIGHLARLGLSGYGIALAVLFLFLRQWRAVAVVGIAVPVSVLGALALLYVFGQSLNLVSLIGLSLSVGLLIDNSIVVYEAVLRRLERGVDTAEATRMGVRRTARAIAAASLTTAVVFLPLSLVDMETSTRTLIEILALSILLPLAASLLVAVGLVPVLAQRLAAGAAIRHMARQRQRRRLAGGLMPPDPARILFGGLVAGALRRPAGWLAGILFVVLASIVIALPLALSNNASPDAEQADKVQFTARYAKGRGSMQALGSAVSQVEQAVMAVDGVDTVFSDLSEEGASIVVNFVDADQRPSGLTVSRVREVAHIAAERIRGFEVLRPGEDRQRRSEGAEDAFASGPGEVALSGPESAALERLARDVVARLETVPGVERAWRWVPPGQEEIWVEPIQRGIEAFGLTAGEVLPVVQLAGREGMPVGERFVLPSGRELPVVIERAGARDPAGARDLRALRIHTDSGVAPMAALASIRQMPPPPVIVHRNGRRESSVFFRLDPDLPSSGPGRDAVDAEIAAVVHAVPRQPGYAVEIREDDEQTSMIRKVGLPAVLLLLSSR